MYLHRRGSHWWIRKAVPVDLVGILGIAVVRRSLRTKDSALARRRALQLLIRVDDVYAVLRSKRPLRPTREVALALLDEALRNNRGPDWAFDQKHRSITEAQTAISNFIAEPDCGFEGDDDDEARVDDTSMVSSDDAFLLLRKERPVGPTNEAAVALLNAVSQMASIHPSQVAAGGRAAAGSIRSLAPESKDPTLAALQAIMAQLAELRGMVDAANSSVADLRSSLPVHSASVDADALSQVLAEDRRSRWSDELLSSAIGRYEIEVIAKSANGLKHIEDVKKRLSVFLAFVTDKPIRDVSRDDLKSYRDHLECLPDRSELRFKTSDIREAVELNANRKQPYPPIGPTTVNLKYLGPVNRLFDWLVDDGKIERNPGTGIHATQKDSKGAKHKRLPMKPEQISRFFAVTAKEPQVSAVYWLPPLMLFTGARLNELAQLRTDDLRSHNGRPHLSILCLDDGNDETGDEAPKQKRALDSRQVKTDAARRVIPVHNELLKIGFPEFVSSQRARKRRDCQLFDKLKANRHGHWSPAVSKALNKRLRLVGITNPVYSAYSLRHSFRDACVDGGMREETRMKFMGHQLPGMSGVYGDPYPLPTETDEMDLVAFPKVDLTPYRK